MKIVIFCGGKGTRIREEAEHRPKPMIEIGGKPILWHIMKMYSVFGFKEFVLCLGYKQEYIREYFLNYEFMNNDFTIDLHSRKKVMCHKEHDDDWNVTLVDTGLETKKGRRLKLVEQHISGDRFMVTYGDVVADVNIQALLAQHKKEGKIATFTGVHPISRFATIRLDRKGRVSFWKEKRPIEEYINSGFFVFERKIFDYLKKDEELEEGPMEKLVAKGEVAMYRHEGFWQCMDTYRDWLFLDGLWKKGSAPWKICEK